MTTRARARRRVTTTRALQRARGQGLRQAEVLMPSDDELIEALQPDRERRRQEDHHLRGSLRQAERLGTPLNLPSMAFRVSAEQAANALITGPRRYMTRLRRIEIGVEQVLDRARTAWTELAAHHAGSPSRFARAWQAWVRSADLATLNGLIAAHNEWYPVEANLRIDIRTGDYITHDGRDYRHEPITPTWLLVRFPPDLTQALAAGEADNLSQEE